MLELEQIARFEFKLELGSVTQTVQITASAPLINTEDGSKGDVIGRCRWWRCR